MFKKTNPNPQMDMFSSPVMLLNVRASKKYSDTKEWHNQFYRFYTSKVDESLFKVLFPEGKKSGRPTASIRVDGKPSIITSVQVEKATFADCHFLQEAVENSERVTNATVEDLYADGAYQSPENRSFAEGHGNMKLKTGKMQGGARWELELHEHDDGLTVREVATGKTYEAVKSETFKGKHKRWRIP